MRVYSSAGLSCQIRPARPSRASLLTGQAFYRLEEGAQNWGTLAERFKGYPDLLEAAGYHVGYTGKPVGPMDWRASGRRRNPAGSAYNELTNTPPTSEISHDDYSGNFREFLKDRKSGQPFCFWYGGAPS